MRMRSHEAPRVTYAKLVPIFAIAAGLTYLLATEAEALTRVIEAQPDHAWGTEESQRLAYGLGALVTGLASLISGVALAGKVGFDIGWYAGYAANGGFRTKNRN